MVEVRPLISERVSVATLVTNRELRLANFVPPKDDQENDLEKSAFRKFYEELAYEFSRQNKEKDELSYLPTQYLSEYIKQCGFDGLRFESSLNPGGINLVIFDPQACDIISFELHIMKNITYETQSIFPLDEEVYTTLMKLTPKKLQEELSKMSSEDIEKAFNNAGKTINE